MCCTSIKRNQNSKIKKMYDSTKKKFGAVQPNTMETHNMANQSLIDIKKEPMEEVPMHEIYFKVDAFDYIDVKTENVVKLEETDPDAVDFCMNSDPLQPLKSEELHLEDDIFANDNSCIEDRSSMQEKYEKIESPEIQAEKVDSLSPTRRKKKLGKTEYECFHCTRRFLRKRNLEKHIDKVHNRACPICFKTYVRKKNLEKHIQRHLKKKNEQREEERAKPSLRKPINLNRTCPICKRVLSSNSWLKVHMRSCSGERPYTCTYCPKTFPIQRDLNRHLFKHTGTKEYKCETCNKAFSEKYRLQAHLRRHRSKEERGFRCKACKEVFASSYIFRQHYHSQHRERLFECHYCRKKFIHKPGISYHLLKHQYHKGFLLCLYCDQKFPNDISFKIHIKDRISCQKMIPKKICTICNKPFNNNYSLKAHMSRSHVVQIPNFDI